VTADPLCAPRQCGRFVPRTTCYPLGSEAIKELLDDLLSTDSSLRSLTDLIRQRTGGNPFFIEEIVQALVETGVVTGGRGAYGTP